jgi:phenylalanyl-tRNA synthetase beta chain
MLCSAKELGLSEDHSGIMIFPPDTKLGVPLSEIYKDMVDVCLEIDNKSITHRPDLWCHFGFAREIGAIFGRKVTDPVKHDLYKTFKNEAKINIKIENPEASPRYSALIVKNIKIAESPDWLKAAVTSIGMRPINNIVDITNYVMCEIGEPMHAFDRKKLNGDSIIIRMAADREKMTTLDGQVHELCTEDVVIADKSGAIALAGVMGGGNSEIEDSTSEIVLEAANFNPVNIRKTAQKYNLRTEAAIRFEKSLSPDITIHALIRCYDLIKQVNPEAEACSEILDSYPVKQEKTVIQIACSAIRKSLGEEIPDERIIKILEALGFDIEKQGEKLSITVPFYRASKDVSIAADIVEEVGRIYGYDNISPMPPMVPCTAPELNLFRLFERKVKNILSFECGLIETSGYSFTGETILRKLGIDNDLELRLKNPLSAEQDRLRRSLMPNIVNFVISNKRFNEEFSIYEMGRVYLKSERKSADLAAENTRTAGAVYSKKVNNAIFYNAKNIILTLCERLQVKNFEIKVCSKDIPEYAHPVRCAEISIGGKASGLIFELHPLTAKEFDITGSAAFFDIDLNAFYNAEKNSLKFYELQKFPEVPFEISVIADSRTYSSDIIKSAAGASKNLIKDIQVISVFEGNQIQEGKKSVSLKIIFSSDEKTLTTDEITSLQKNVIDSMKKSGYELR